MSNKNYFNYDKKTIQKYIKKDIDDVIYKNNIEIYINNIIAIVNEANKNDIDPYYLLKKVKNRLLPSKNYKKNILLKKL